MGTLNRIRNEWTCPLVLLAALGGLTAPAQAATLPAPATAGQIDPGLQRQLQERNREQQLIEERARRTEVPALKGDAPAEQALPEQGVRLQLSGITFNRSVFLERAKLEQLARGYVGREIGFADLNELLRSINSLYEAQGQLTARALIPPQSLEQGVLRVVLVEAKVDAVGWKQPPQQVAAGFYEQRLAVQPDQVLDSPALMTAIQRFNATTPGPQVTASLAPGARFGTTRVDLEAFEPQPWQWSLFANNYGNEGSGREQYGASLTWFSPTGAADALSATLIGTSASEYASLRYSRPVNRYNGVAFVELGVNSLQVEEGPYADLGIEGDSSTWGLGYDHPWWIDEHWLLTFGTGFNQQDSETTIEGFPLSETSTRELLLRGQVEYRAQPWYLRHEQRIRQAAMDNQVSGDSGSYTLLNGDTYLARQIGQGFQAVGRLGWQFASDTQNLPAGLYYQFGGISSLRGYDAGIISAPQGFTLNLEGRWHYSDSLQPFVFFDYGRAMELGIADVELQSAGIGVEYQWDSHVSLSLLAANPLKDVVPDQNGGQVLFQITLR